MDILARRFGGYDVYLLLRRRISTIMRSLCAAFYYFREYLSQKGVAQFVVFVIANLVIAN